MLAYATLYALQRIFEVQNIKPVYEFDKSSWL